MEQTGYIVRILPKKFYYAHFRTFQRFQTTPLPLFGRFLSTTCRALLHQLFLFSKLAERSANGAKPVYEVYFMMSIHSCPASCGLAVFYANRCNKSRRFCALCRTRILRIGIMSNACNVSRFFLIFSYTYAYLFIVCFVVLIFLLFIYLFIFSDYGQLYPKNIRPADS